ncbi:hypothetical protein FRC15_004301 [Serendipita sp. 397]|nr:hypothetical protein FRC15_004301 [Serendipita sp. 397]
MSSNFLIRRPTPASNDGSDVESKVFKVPAIPQRLQDQRSRSGSPLNPNGKRKLNFDDSDEEEDKETEELVIGFDAMGAQRWVGYLPSQNASSYSSPKSPFGINSAKESPKQSGPPIIPALPNRDWKAIARQRRGIIPDTGRAMVGADGSQGGLGTKDVINSGPQQSGLVVFKKRKIEEPEETPNKMETDIDDNLEQEDVPLTDEQRAVNALLHAAKQANDGTLADDVPIIAIPMISSGKAMTEAEVFRDDVKDLPDEPTKDDYDRMPVSQFGTALLMGMGWKPGQGAGKSGKGPTEAFVPKSRPALLGLGAKVDEAQFKQNVKASKRYIPIVAKERERNDEGSKGASTESSQRDTDRDLRRQRERSTSRERDSDRRDSRDYRGQSSSHRRDERRDDRYRDREDDGRSERRRDDSSRREDRRRDEYKGDDKRRDDDYHRNRDDRHSERSDDRRDSSRRRK